MAKYKSEKDFQSAFIKRLQSEGIYVRNIPDIGNTRKPFDISLNYLGKGGAVELKYIKTAKVPTPDAVYKMLYPHQVANLIQFQSGKSRGVSLVFTYHSELDMVYCYKIKVDNEYVRLEEEFFEELHKKDFMDKINLIFMDK